MVLVSAERARGGRTGPALRPGAPAPAPRPPRPPARARRQRFARGQPARGAARARPRPREGSPDAGVSVRPSDPGGPRRRGAPAPPGPAAPAGRTASAARPPPRRASPRKGGAPVARITRTPAVAGSAARTRTTLQAARARQPPVQHGHRRARRPGQGERPRPVGGLQHRVPGPAQHVGQHRRRSASSSASTRAPGAGGPPSAPAPPPQAPRLPAVASTSPCSRRSHARLSRRRHRLLSTPAPVGDPALPPHTWKSCQARMSSPRSQ